MTASSQEYVEFVVDQLAAIPGIAHSRFFGGTGLSAHGTQFAMLMGDSLYFVVDDLTRPKYETLGSLCFSYATKRGRVQVKRYYRIPEEILEAQDELVALARESIQIAAATRKAKRRG